MALARVILTLMFSCSLMRPACAANIWALSTLNNMPAHSQRISHQTLATRSLVTPRGMTALGTAFFFQKVTYAAGEAAQEHTLKGMNTALYALGALFTVVSLSRLYSWIMTQQIAARLPQGIAVDFERLFETDEMILPRVSESDRRLMEAAHRYITNAEQLIVHVRKSDALERPVGAYGPTPLPRLLAALRELQILKANDRVLDLGSGLGAFALPVAKRFGVFVDGVELDPTLFEQSLSAQRQAIRDGFIGEGRIKFFKDDYAKPEYWGDYDAYYYYAFGSLNSRDIVRRAIRSMKPGSHLILFGLTWDDLEGHYSFERHFDLLFSLTDFHFHRVPGLGVWVFTKLAPPTPQAVGAMTPLRRAA